MTMGYLLLVLSVLVGVYLSYALIDPERF